VTRKQQAADPSKHPQDQTATRARSRPVAHDENLIDSRQKAPKGSHPRTLPQGRLSSTWKLEEAKAKFSEVVRRAHDHGPQYVTVRGKRTVAVIDAAELDRLRPVEPPRVPLVQFLESLYVEGLDLGRDRDPGRDVV
jgi:antitoxin Phd